MRGRSFGPVTLSVDAHQAVHFSSVDLENGNAAKKLPSGVGSGRGDWHLQLSSELEIEVLSYVRTGDGFFAAMHDMAPSEDGGHRVPIFHPADEPNQASLLRLVNLGGEGADVAIRGTDDMGLSPGGGATVSVAPGTARTLTSSELESGSALGMTGSLGDGAGMWRLHIESSQPIIVMSLMSDPAGHVTSLSTSRAEPEEGVNFVPLFPSASDSHGRQGFVRVANHSDATREVTIIPRDDSDWEYAPLVLTVHPRETVHFDSLDLELGNTGKGLRGSTGSGLGDWWLELSGGPDIEVASYVRAADGFLTAMHDTAPGEGAGRRVATFGPANETNGTGVLRLVNPGAREATAIVAGTDDLGRSPGSEVRIVVGAGASRTLSSAELESGGPQSEGALGDGAGMWRLSVESDAPLIVTNFHESRAGRLTNLSTAPTGSDAMDAPNPQLEVGTMSVDDADLEGGGSFTLSGSVRNAGDAESPATTLRYYRSTDTLISTQDTEVGTDAVDALPASGSSAESVLLTAPLDAGTYHYGACVDTVAGESDTADNCSPSVSVNVEAPRTSPDLEVGAPTVSDSGPETGASFTLSATVTNAGDADAAATTLRYYRSANTLISTLDTEVGTDAVAALSASGTSAESITLTAPATAGTYYYGACVDAVTGESEISDNCSAPLRVVVKEPGERPDLGVGAPSVDDASPDTGGSFTLSATVTNSGDADAAATTLRYHRSINATISRLDPSVGTDPVDALPASGSSEESVTLVAPRIAGVHYYGACVDAVAGESATGDNCSASVRVEVGQLGPGPDLEVHSTAVSDRRPSAGATIALSATVRNTGNAASVATTLRYYRSTNVFITKLDTEVGTDAVAALPAWVSGEESAGSARSIALVMPQDAGVYYYGACVDVVVNELERADNCSASVTVEVREARDQPDLGVGTPTVSDGSPLMGASFTLSATVTNAGDGASAATTLRYYRSADSTITTSDTSVGADAVGALSASGTNSESITLTAPAMAGTYYYGACVDSVAGESDTTSNCSSSVQVTVAAPPSPDLAVYAVVASTSPGGTPPGGTIGLSAGVRNDGDESSAATTLRYYQSTDATITTADTEVGTVTVGELSAGATTTPEGVDATAPPSAGAYYYGACVDAVTGESDTTNNCSGSAAVIVGTPAQYPDLAVGTPTVSDPSPETGASFTLSATVSNAGDGASAATTLRYYRVGGRDDHEFGHIDGDGRRWGHWRTSGTSAESISLSAPSTAGTYYYGA